MISLRFAVILLLAVSFSVRFGYSITHISFSQDQARDVLLMDSLRNEGAWLVPLGPKASVGDFYLPPLYYQLHYILSLLTNNNPLTMHWFITFIESLTPLVLFFIARAYLSRENSLLIGIIMALSPLAIIFGTFSWNPNMIPFFTSISLLSWINLWQKGGIKWLYFGGITTIFALHLHYQSIVVAPFVVIILMGTLLRYPKLLIHYLVLVIIGILSLSGYLYSEYNNDWINSRAIYRYISINHAQTYDRISKPAYFYSFLPAFVERVLLGGNRQFYWIGQIVLWLGGIIFLILLKNRDKPWMLLGLYFVIILIMLRVYRGDKIDYYLSMLFILPPILIGLIFSRFRVITILLLLFIGFSAGKHIAGIENSNGLKELDTISNFVSSYVNNHPVRTWLHHPDLYYPVEYLVKYNKIKESKESKYLLEICFNNQNCYWDNTPFCDIADHAKPHYIKAALFKSKNNYKYLSTHRTQTYQVILGELAN